MADTERTLNELLTTLFKDGQVQGISAQDLRDSLVSVVNDRGGFYVAEGDEAETTISASSTWTSVAGTTTALPGQVNEGFSMPSDGVLQYDGGVDRAVRVSVTITASAAGNNINYDFALAVNGSPQAQTQVDAFLVQNEKTNIALEGLFVLEPGDQIEVQVQNESDASNITADSLQLIATAYLI